MPWTYVVSDLKGKEILGKFYKKNCKKQIKKSFKSQKVIKRKYHELYVKWKGYDNSFNT